MSSLQAQIPFPIPRPLLSSLGPSTATSPTKQQQQQHRQQTVLLLSGLCASGKSTLAKSLMAHFPNRFVRLSIDVYIYDRHGAYERDYPAERYAALQDEGEEWVKGELRVSANGDSFSHFT